MEDYLNFYGARGEANRSSYMSPFYQQQQQKIIDNR